MEFHFVEQPDFTVSWLLGIESAPPCSSSSPSSPSPSSSLSSSSSSSTIATAATSSSSLLSSTSSTDTIATSPSSTSLSTPPRISVKWDPLRLSPHLPTPESTLDSRPTSSPSTTTTITSGQNSASTYSNAFINHDRDFSVTWLLGLKQHPHFERYPWARSFVSTDPTFLVSRILGLIPDPANQSGDRSGKDKKLTDGEEEEVADEEAEGEGDKDESEPFSNTERTFGLARMFGEEDPSDEDEEGNTKDEADTPSITETPVLAEPEFLDLCSKMEQMFIDIETANLNRDDDIDNESLDGLGPEEVEDDSPSRKEWIRQKKIEYASNKYLDRIMSLPGQEETKELFLNTKAKFKAAERRETSIKKENFDMVFTGRQGTGKSTMAYLYTKLLISLGYVPRATILNPGWQRFTSYGFSKSATVDVIRSQSAICGGFIAIVEDAHLLNKDILNLWNFYVRASEITNPVTLIFAGDPDQGLSGLLTYRAQAETHFPVIKLPDYTQEQLQVIFHGMIRVAFSKKMKLEGEDSDDHFVKILTRRIHRRSGEKSFGNAWEVRKAFLEACRRQVSRFRAARSEGTYLEDWLMTKEDILGNKPSLGPEKSEAWKELQGLVGLDSVKESILAVVNQVNQNYQREMRGDELLPITSNRVFLGSPGTGKTTVAKLYGKILADFGILTKGHLIVKNPSDLIDRYVGGSENNTRDALSEAKGSVLIIDDAHMLDPGSRSDSHDADGSFRTAILDTLVAEVSGLPGEDRCVILCGYPDKMKEMYQNCNPGFARRFPLDNAFVFEDFSSETLMKILDIKLDKEKLKVTDKAREVAEEMLRRASVRPNFGNGGEVDNILAKAITARTRRITKSGTSDEANWDLIALEPEDFDPEWDRLTRAVTNTRALFSDFIGYEEIISQFESYQYMVQGMRLRNVDPRPYIPFTYVFKGPPGTGKTTTARKLGQIFYDMGFLSAPEVIEVSASQLIGEYVGQTGPKTTRLLESALGKVLFIDEAYRLGSGGQFTQEAVSELVDAVTKTKFAKKLIIVLAGYEEDMDRLLRSNQGMRSRFPTEFTFRPMRAEQCMEQLRRVVSKVGISIQDTREMEPSTRNNLMGALQRMTGEKGWASGRSVDTLGEKLIGHMFKEVAVRGLQIQGDMRVTGRELVTILSSSAMGTPGLKIWSSSGPMGARAVMTLRDLESEGH